MLQYSVYSEAGGVGKTTTAVNLAAAHADAGLDVLVIDMDPQNASLSYLLDVDDDRASEDADTLVHHMVDKPRGPFEDLIRTADHGIDVIPTHNRFEQLQQLLMRAAEMAEGLGSADEDFELHAQLLRVLRENEVNEDYDILIIDPPANGEVHQNNALFATRNVVIPVELSGKGKQSVDGLEQIVGALESTFDIEMGVLALVPFKYEATNDQRAYLDRVEQMKYEVPVVIGKRTSLMEGCWDERCTAFRYVDEHRERDRDHELETLEKFESLARRIEEKAGVQADTEEVVA